MEWHCSGSVCRDGGGDMDDSSQRIGLQFDVATGTEASTWHNRNTGKCEAYLLEPTDIITGRRDPDTSQVSVGAAIENRWHDF